MTNTMKGETMWKLMVRDAAGQFLTWEVGETALEAAVIARSRRGAGNVLAIMVDQDGAPISTIEPAKFDAFGYDVTDEWKAWRAANWQDDGSAR